MGILAGMVLIVGLLVGAVYFFKGCYSFFKKNGKAKKDFMLMGLFGIVIPLVCAPFLGEGDVDTAKEESGIEAKAEEQKKNNEPFSVYDESLEDQYEQTLNKLNDVYEGNFLLRDFTLNIHKFEKNYYATSINSFDGYFDDVDAEKIKLFDRKQIDRALSDHQFIEFTEERDSLIPKVDGKTNKFMLAGKDSSTFVAYRTKKFIGYEEEDFYALRFFNLKSASNETTEDLFEGILGKNVGQSTMKWYTSLQTELKNPIYYDYNQASSFSTIYSIHFVKKIGDYSFIMSAAYDEEEKGNFEDRFMYYMEIRDESYIKYLADVYSEGGLAATEIDFSKENTMKLIDLVNSDLKEQTTIESSSITISGEENFSEGVVTITNDVANVRQDAIIDSPVIYNASKGETFEYAGKTYTMTDGRRWHAVIVDGENGYISSAVGELSSDTTVKEISEPQQQGVGIVVVTGDEANVRLEPSLDAEGAYKAGYGDSFNYMGETLNTSDGREWYLISAGTEMGYISSDVGELQFSDVY